MSGALTRWALRGLGTAAVVLVAVAVLVFALFEALDSDAATVILARQGSTAPSQEQLAALRAELGLDRAAPVRFAEWAWQFAHGDLGTSLLSGRPVADVLLGRLANSAALALVTAVLLVPLAIGLGLLAGARPGSRTDRAISMGALTAESLPPFVSGVVLIATVALTLRLLPAVSLLPTGASVWSRPEILVLPVLCLLAGLAPHPVRMVRAQTAQVVAAPYVRTARLNGVRGPRLLLRHVAPNAISAAVHPLAGSLVGLIGGIAVVETLFVYPGVSQELLRAVAGRDFPFVQSAAVLLAAAGVGLYLIADLVTMLASPRARDLILADR
ncbi:ABC transporter permease [Nocardia sp. NPDC057353]|uniref:ABC transporter permease n=1 Tax=Nocardia sp. NPDC057353 TaxID=3346104 RepID=UPI00362981AD